MQCNRQTVESPLIDKSSSVLSFALSVACTFSFDRKPAMLFPQKLLTFDGDRYRQYVSGTQQSLASMKLLEIKYLNEEDIVSEKAPAATATC